MPKKIAVIEIPEFGLWGEEKIELRKVPGGLAGEMRVTADTEMGKIGYTRAVSITISRDSGRLSAPIDFTLEIKDKKGSAKAVDPVVRNNEFHLGLPIHAELRMKGTVEWVNQVILDDRETDSLQGELNSLFGEGVKKYFETELQNLRTSQQRGDEFSKGFKMNTRV